MRPRWRRNAASGRVLVPVEPGTMCARGILLSDVSLDLVRSEITPADEAELAAHHGTLRHDAGQAAAPGWRASTSRADRRRFERVIEARYKGQNHEVQVRLPATMCGSAISSVLSRTRIAANTATTSRAARSRW